MSKTSVIGFPRFGAQRELKRLVEGYFSKQVNKTDLLAGGKELRKKHWVQQFEAGIDYIPSNDFSLYDTFLDMACLLNVIPSQYKKLQFDYLDTYFTMARGFQDSKHDIKALEMKKWFNTNYHYIVPEIDNTTEFKLSGDKPFSEYNEALKLGIHTKPVIIGPVTFLKLCKNKSEKSFVVLLSEILGVYIDILQHFNALGLDMLQIDEPAIVMDMDKEDIEYFVFAYERLLKEKGSIKVLLQTYFGDVRDIYQELMTLDFEAVGLDLIEGQENIKLIQENGFPEDKNLFAGIVNGKNIWVNDYSCSLSKLKVLQEKINRDRIIINTSCSLLYVPFTVKNENKMDGKYKKHMAFAREKLVELKEIADLFNDDKYMGNTLFTSNQLLIKEKERANSEVRKKTHALSPEDFIRKVPYSVRKEKQKGVLQLPLLPSTTIGSFPQTSEVRNLRSAFRKGTISLEEYKNQIKEYIQNVIKIQEDAGIDVLVHGEYERNDMVEYFGENMEGFLFTENAWVQSYGTRGVKPPIIFGDIERNRPITVEWIEYAQSLTDKPVKGILTGPVTILNWSFLREDLSLSEIAFQIGLAIKEEVMDLEKAGIRIIQIDEAALREKLPLRKAVWHEQYLDWAIKAFRLVHSSVKPETQIHTHMCYSEFSDIIEEIDDMDADVYTFEAAKSDFILLEVLKNYGFSRQVGPGVYDIHSPRIPGQEEICELLKVMNNNIKIENLWVNPDCGLKTRGEKETIPSLINMVNATRQYREKINN